MNRENYEELSKLSVTELEQRFIESLEQRGEQFVEVRVFFVRLVTVAAVSFVVDWSGVRLDGLVMVSVVILLFLLAAGCTVFMMAAVVRYHRTRIACWKYRTMLTGAYLQRVRDMLTSNPDDG